ncbi:hypothetical protein Ahy_A07g034064 [Arachis hypogaea]|uniref:Replication protein A 70 kDa DNA-binding subunit B/D first OB fold domain-containing protein n=1 Tax=Arachis hypogaea TaxID=3818 RepID=A0A445CAV7_ARAHY|nr:hypothetical protein Ahy_A07g034064 [Arachis hypogaea]
MHASVGKDLISVFESLISEGVVYVFTYFGVSNNCGLYRTTSHQFRLFFQARTTVLPSFCDAIPLYDVAGVMTGVEGERKYVKDGKIIDMLVIHIENDGLKLNVTVLGEMLDQIKDFVASDEQQLPEVIFQFARVKNIRGMLLINPNVPEPVMFRKRYDLIKCINAGPEHKVWKFIVRVIRLWTVSHFANSGMKEPTEMVVLDEEGDTIQCAIKDIFVPIFESLLTEGNVYVVTNFAVALNTIKFKPTRHEFRIHFKRDTVVRPVQDSSVPLNEFNFVPFKKIHAESREDGYLVDVIGQLASKGNLVEFTQDGKPSSYITIELDDLEGGQKLRVTLWQTFVLDLFKYLKEHPCLTYVVILQRKSIGYQYTICQLIANNN